MEQVRAFIAIELPDDLKSDLSRLLDRLKPGQERAVKWANPDSVHLTLKFLGNIPAEKIADITQAITKVAARARLFTLNLEGLGAFPNLRSPRVVWVGVEGNVPRVLDLQRQIDQALVPLDFLPEARAFSPHLTLGRVRDRATPQERSHLGQIISSSTIDRRLSFTVDKVVFMKSTLTSTGAIYDCLASIPLDTG